MRIRWTPVAAEDLQDIGKYLKDYQPHYRQPTMRKLYETIRSLKKNRPIAADRDVRKERARFCFRPCLMSLYTACESRALKFCASITPRRTGPDSN